MKFIILKGASNTGKTATLKYLIELLLNDKSFKLFDICRDFYNKMNIPEADVWAKFCHDGKHVVITTLGDSVSDTINNYDRHKLGCDVYICACHDTDHCITALKNRLGAKNSDFVDKSLANSTSSSHCNIVNRQQAQALYKKLLTII